MTATSNSDKLHLFTSFDGGIRCDGRLIVPDDKSVIVGSGSFDNLELIPRGAGISFAAASFGEGITSIDTTKLNKIAVLDHELQTITVDAGVSVGVLLEYLLAHGYVIPVLPGYQTITVGGCIAANIHGKNPARDGNFIHYVDGFTLHHVEHGVIVVTRDTERDLFDLTFGGFGLTGTIVSVTLRIKPLASNLIDLSVQPIAQIEELPKLLCDAADMNDYLVSWHDFNQAGARFGSGFLQCGKISAMQADTKFERTSESTATTTFPIMQPKLHRAPLTLTSETRGANFPAIYGRVTTGIMNAFYRHNQTLNLGCSERMPLGECFFPGKTSRDLYFHAFGKNGLHEYQVLIPVEHFIFFIEKIRWWLMRNDLPITMASSKLFRGSSTYLYFDGSGICLALDFPRCQTASEFLGFLDILTIETGSLPNIHKDSRLPLPVVEAAYAGYHVFRSKLREFDPKRRYQSELSRRLAL
ncbi:MAG: FAD-binding oxidoreductase [Candidatus Melainabacteria bacterium]|nr:FAD-binding oxidoreductase [Candidatus Melainabacteria bacterium]